MDFQRSGDVRIGFRLDEILHNSTLFPTRI